MAKLRSEMFSSKDLETLGSALFDLRGYLIHKKLIEGICPGYLLLLVGDQKALCALQTKVRR